MHIFRLTNAPSSLACVSSLTARALSDKAHSFLTMITFS